MKIKLMLGAFALIGAFLFTEVAQAQNLTITNFTGTTFQAGFGWANDDCSQPGSIGGTLAPGANVIPPPIGFTGAWKAWKAGDQCGGNAVEHPVGCFGVGVQTSTFTDCAGNIVTLVWIDEVTGVIF